MLLIGFAGADVRLCLSMPACEELAFCAILQWKFGNIGGQIGITGLLRRLFPR